ncbi:MAG: DUF222 domain-containing protein [Pseudonocardiales bacterium]
MFEQLVDEEAPTAGAPFEEDWFDPAWLDEAPWLDGVAESEDTSQVPMSACAPSGWLALELDQITVDPARLSDTDLIEGIIAFDRVVSWAGARQAGLLAEFARRRPENYSQPTRSDVPVACSNYASDEVGLALKLSRSAALGRLMMAQTLVEDLPGTLAAWEAGTLDVLKVQAITETSYVLTPEQRVALEARVLPRAGTQTRSQLRAALTRAVLAIDPDGAAARHQQRRKDRRVVVSPDETGMATLWALLSAPDATAAYQRLCQLARKLGAEDPRGMDARRADLLVDLLTGRRCAATGDCQGPDCECADDCSNDSAHGCDNGDGVDDGRAETPPADACPDTEGPDTNNASTNNASTETDTAEPTHAQNSAQPTSPTDPADRGGVNRGEHCCGTARRTGSGPGKPLISVIVPITMLLGLDEQPGELVGHGPIPAALAREIAAEGTWRRLLTDPASGTLLDYGRTTYTPPTGLADFVRARDLYCRNPICRQLAATADLDHTIPWPEGTTSEHNLYAGCRHDHLMKTHAPGWHVDQYPDGRITWTTPTGHTYTSHPHDYRSNPIDQTHPPPENHAPETSAPQTEVEAEYNPDLDPPPF